MTSVRVDYWTTLHYDVFRAGSRVGSVQREDWLPRLPVQIRELIEIVSTDRHQGDYAQWSRGTVACEQDVAHYLQELKRALEEWEPQYLTDSRLAWAGEAS